MIVLIDDLDQKGVGKNLKKPTTVLGRLHQVLTKIRDNHRKRRANQIAVRQLMQLNDALLKDIGLSRDELMCIRNGTSTFDSLVKQNIMLNRDNACSTISLRR